MNDVIGGHISFMFAALSIVKGNVQAGKLHMIGVGSDHRSSEFPDVPTISESGVPGFEAKSWFGLVAPAGTRPDIIKKINQDVTKVILDRAFADKYLAAQGLEPIVGTPEQFAAFIRAETIKWGKVVKEANIKVTK
jgi:tripartite-type tricarboxylate transporter receptor subunit TctC